MRTSLALFTFLLLGVPPVAAQLPNTKLLDTKDDLAKVMVEGIDRYLTRATEQAVAKRADNWKADFTSNEAYERSIQPNRERLRKILGVVDDRVRFEGLEFVATTAQPALVAQTKTYKMSTVRWPVLPGVEGEGLLLEPIGSVVANVVAIPDPDDKFGKFDPLRFVECGCRVVVPTLIDRADTWSGNAELKRLTNQSHREFIHRMAFQMGRTLIGYEIQRVEAVIDWFARENLPIGIAGHGEGGMLAFYASALDPRINVTLVSGHFGPREKLHDEPIDRNIWKLLTEFGDAEVIRLIVPRALIIDHAPFSAPGPKAATEGRRAAAAPGKLGSVDIQDAVEELRRFALMRVPITANKKNSFQRPAVVMQTSTQRIEEEKIVNETRLEPILHDFLGSLSARYVKKTSPLRLEPPAMSKRSFDQLVDFTQKRQLPSSVSRQAAFWNKLDTTSLAAFEKSQIPLREKFWSEVNGKLPTPTMPLNPRSRLILETAKWKGYEVVLDVYEDVISFGILLVPNDLKAGEKRPVVVCQHGLEGRPMDVVDPTKKTRAYNSFGAQLADLGYVVFAPQNPYILQNQFRQLVRKSHPLGLTLYAFIIRQHERILEFLNTLPFVDGRRIAYYGLSYGGKVALRAPAILDGYCLSICSGDFNEWIWKNITLDWGGSYMFTHEYEIYEFDLASTFNHAEMAALVAPRPFMVERGHNDGVGIDEYVALEYAKVRRLYAKLGIADRTEIGFFQGGHEIHGQASFAFLAKHLNWK